MDMANGCQPLPFGHFAEAAVDIEGLAVSPSILRFLPHLPRTVPLLSS